MNPTDLLGLAAGFLTTVAFVPQVAKVWKDRSAKELSLKTFLAFSSGVVLWLLYGIVLGEFPMILWNAVTLALVAAIVVMKLRFG
jgi:MtN3 and saliva related transmembrane protein